VNKVSSFTAQILQDVLAAATAGNKYKKGTFDEIGAVPMKQLHTEVEIEAPAERVWELLTDFATYPEWNPFIRSISGQPAPGERLEVRIEPPSGRGMTF
jgi:uncharacterized membrane protein